MSNQHRHGNGNPEELSATIRLEIRDEVEKRVEMEVARAHRFYKYLAAIVILAFGVAGYFTFRDVMQKFLSSTDAAAKIQAFNTQYSQFQITYSAYTNRLSELNAIDDIVTSETLQTNVSALQVKIRESEKLLSDFTNTVNQENAAIGFYSTLADAINDSRPAFLKLKDIANDPKDRFSSEAQDAVNSIVADFSQLVLAMADDRSYPWPKGTDIGKITFEQVLAEDKNATRVNEPFLINFVWNNPSFSPRKKMQFYLNVAHSSKSNHAAALAGLYFKQGAGLLDVPPFSEDTYDAWWSTNQTRFPQ